MIMGLILQEDRAVLNVSAPTSKSKYLRQNRIEPQGDMDTSTTQLKISTPTSNGQTQQAQNQDVRNSKLCPPDLRGIYRTPHPATLFSSPHSHSSRVTTFWAIQHILASLKEQKTYNMLSDHNRIKSESSERGRRNPPNAWRLDSIFLNNV